MMIIPAIDIISGHVVRLTQGDYKRRKDYSSDPVKTARGFRSAGAGMIHIVDLDGAREGRPVNLAAVKSILNDKDINLPLQFGGPKVWIAGNSEAALQRAARLGDGWHPTLPNPQEMVRLLAKVCPLLGERDFTVCQVQPRGEPGFSGKASGRVSTKVLISLRTLR
ncbi:MAG: LLM class flavin-dependent oxidoreductase [Clostridia bacterium]|nr:LLM class flavin-dependent oxidoreductase [Clostridia bacterium]